MLGTLVSFAADWGWAAGPVGMVAAFFARSKWIIIAGAVAGLLIVGTWGWVALERRAEKIEAQAETIRTKTAEVERERTAAREAAAVAQRNAEEIKKLEAIAEGRRQEAAEWSSRINAALARHAADVRRFYAAPGQRDPLPPALGTVVDILHERAAARAAPGDRSRGPDDVRPAGRPPAPGVPGPPR